MNLSKTMANLPVVIFNFALSPYRVEATGLEPAPFSSPAVLILNIVAHA